MNANLTNMVSPLSHGDAQLLAAGQIHDTFTKLCDLVDGNVDLRKVVDRLGRLGDDDRLASHRSALADANLSDLIRSRDELNRVIDLLGGDRQ